MMYEESFNERNVYITDGPYTGRIGYVDDEDDGDEIVYFGLPWLLTKYAVIQAKNVRPANTDDLINRIEDIYKLLLRSEVDLLEDCEQIDLLHELHLCTNFFDESHQLLVNKISHPSDAKLFLSHSSRDKPFVRRLAADLSRLGHYPWLDEWEIQVGESIPAKVSEGLEGCKALVVVRSEERRVGKECRSRWSPYH